VFTVVALGVGTGALVLAGGPVPELTPVTDPELKAPLAAVMALAVFASTLAVLSLALRFASGYSAVRRYLADASYWVYIVHLPLVMVGQILVVNETWPWFIKFGVVISGTMAISLLTYQLLVRHSFVGGWLNGRRIPRHRQTDAAFSPAE
jgi:peptidoglycan/LPS O-acetylase OafA/YrhL